MRGYVSLEKAPADELGKKGKVSRETDVFYSHLAKLIMGAGKSAYILLAVQTIPLETDEPYTSSLPPK